MSHPDPTLTYDDPHKGDPVNELSVKEYNLMKIQEKKEQLAEARTLFYKTLGQITDLEKELIDLYVEQIDGKAIAKAEGR